MEHFSSRFIRAGTARSACGANTPTLGLLLGGGYSASVGEEAGSALRQQGVVHEGKCLMGRSCSTVRPWENE